MIKSIQLNETETLHSLLFGNAVFYYLSKCDRERRGDINIIKCSSSLENVKIATFYSIDVLSALSFCA